MLKCKDLAHHAGDYVDGELGFWRRLGIRCHLLICSSCRAFVRKIRISKGFFAQRGLSRLSPEERDDVVNRVIEAAKSNSGDDP